MNLAAPTRFGFLTLPNYSLIACSNAIEALRMANRVAGRDEYTWKVVTPDGESATASNGLALAPTAALDRAGALDLLFVCGGVDVRRSAGRAVAAGLRRLARSGTALGALCTGSFALAEAGLLRGYRCAVHWEDLPALQEEFPDTEFVEDMYAVDRDRITCTGGVAPLDMMLAVVEARLGRDLAAEVSAQFIVERGRAGVERQPTAPWARAAARNTRLAEAVRLIEGSVDAPLAATEVADKVGISVRQLERLFRQHLDTTPGAFSASVRLGRARALLRQTAMPITDVAVACGYDSASHFSTAFRARFGHAPRAERARPVPQRTPVGASP
jgi:AraC family transcriptional regulator, glycine betaine-responsive activator